MRWLFLLLLLPLVSLQAAQPPVSIRLYGEVKETDSDRFSTPITLKNPPKKVFISKVPIMTEKDIVTFFPFAAADGTIGCYFQLDAQGTNKLMQHTVEFRDGLVIAFVNAREAASMTVGKKITDGLLTIPSGFTPEEIVLLQTKYPTIGKEKEFDAQRKKSLDAIKQYKKQQAQQAKAAATPKPKP